MPRITPSVADPRTDLYPLLLRLFTTVGAGNASVDTHCVACRDGQVRDHSMRLLASHIALTLS